MKINELYWAAGFLEGEGCFTYTRGARIIAAQKQLEPLQRLFSLFGGHIYNKPANNTLTWEIFCKRALGIMMTLYSLMSQKRKNEIKRVINKWQATLSQKEIAKLRKRDSRGRWA